MATSAPETTRERVSPSATSARPIEVALLGLGQIGSAVARGAAESPFPGIRIVGALVRNATRRPGISALDARALTSNPADLFAARPDVIVEVLGGVEPAFTLISRALEEGIAVVTANKSLLAAKGAELDAVAARTGTPLLYEASVLAGVPFLGALSRRSRASAVTRIEGIVNGTSNFLLTRMRTHRVGWQEALADAQALGLAEPDPRNDVLGIDAAEKLAVLIRHFRWGSVRPDALETTGIDGLRASDVDAAREFGGVLRPVVAAELNATGLSAFAGPAFVPDSHAFARIDGVENAVALHNGYGRLFYSGPGAGPAATAASVLDDVAEAAAQLGRPYEWRDDRAGRTLTPASPVTAWFVRLESALRLPSRPDLADLLGSHGIWLQRSSAVRTDDGRETSWVLTLPASRGHLEHAIAALSGASRCAAHVVRAREH